MTNNSKSATSLGSVYTRGLESGPARAKVQRDRIQLLRELERLEKQANTAKKCVENEHTTLKISLKQMDKRKRELELATTGYSPKMRQKSSREDRKLLLQNRTIVALPSSLQANSLYGPQSAGLDGEAVKQGGNEDSKLQIPPIKSALHLHINSPHITSPALYRRENLARPFRHPGTLTAVKQESEKVDESTTKLPKVQARPGTATKDKLKKVFTTQSAVFGLDTKSGVDFSKFYGTDSPLNSTVLLDETEREEDAGIDSKEEDDEELTPEQTLEEMYREIKNCRYIRLYQPRKNRRSSVKGAQKAW